MNDDLIDKEKIIGLPVYTQSGVFMGQIVDYLVSDDKKSIIKYFIQPSQPIKGLITGHIEILKENVISIDSEKMVVEDTSIKSREPEFRPAIIN